MKETEFMKGITCEENPFEAETPDSVRTYDLDGNEVNNHEEEHST